MPFSVNLMRKLETVDSELRDVLWSILDEVERNREESVTKTEFRELRDIVRELGTTTYDLAEAQKRTEHRVEELAEAQKRTEHKIEELAEAQKRTEHKVEELAEAQKRTEQELRTLTSEHKETRRQLGGLSMTVGYGLEDKAYPALPALLKRDFNLVVQGRLTRTYVQDKKGQNLEVNIFGKAVKDGNDVFIIGESKSQLSKKEIDAFVRKRLKRFDGVFSDIFPVLVTFMVSSPDVEKYAREQNIALYYSYDF
jgi:hypothetical protein